jgi:hypothetical protein
MKKLVDKIVNACYGYNNDDDKKQDITDLDVFLEQLHREFNHIRIPVDTLEKHCLSWFYKKYRRTTEKIGFILDSRNSLYSKLYIHIGKSIYSYCAFQNSTSQYGFIIVTISNLISHNPIILKSYDDIISSIQEAIEERKDESLRKI